MQRAQAAGKQSAKRSPNPMDDLHRHDRSQPLFHLLVVDRTCLLQYGSAGVKDHKVRDTPHLITCREFRIVFRVHFQDDGSPRHVGSRTRNLGCCNPARTTPSRPEIHEDRNARVLHNFSE
jgi:hypothetical protein